MGPRFVRRFAVYVRLVPQAFVGDVGRDEACTGHRTMGLGADEQCEAVLHQYCPSRKRSPEKVLSVSAPLLGIARGLDDHRLELLATLLVE
ncbi:MAG: hypothetical protein JWN50_635 [Parcubacteria group bacterium]|nr:hypothetical protein [Parcubacteria group bacterium]